MTNLALVGLGHAARSIWTPALQSLSGVTVVAGADPEPGARSGWARLAPRAALHDSLADLLACHGSIDWLVVVSPPDLHAEHALAGLAAGCHVLCEKPAARSAAQLDVLAAAAADADRCVAVNHEFTRMPIFAATLAELQRGAHGPLRFAQVWQLVQDPGATGWRAGGETMREFGTHAVDLLIEAFGGPPSQVSARMPRPAGAPAGDPLDLVTLEWPDGRAAQLVLDRLSPGQHRYMEARFDCAGASLRASIGGRAEVRLGLDPRSRLPRLRLDLAGGGAAWIERGARREGLARNGLAALADATAALTRQTLDAVAARQEPPRSLARVRDVLAVIDAAYASAAQDRVVAVNPQRDPQESALDSDP
jgi:predicted dehydrogenase